jgi:hypothetical protein
LASDETRFYCSDEKAHSAYASYIGEFGELPSFSASANYGDGEAYAYENYQFPAYYVAASALYGRGVFGMRLLSVLFGIGSIVLMALYADIRRVMAFWLIPGVVIVSSMMTNQSMEIFGAACLAYAISRESRLIISLSFVAVAACVFSASKITGLIVVALLLAYYAYRKDIRWAWLVPGIAIGAMSWYSRIGLSGVNSYGDSIVRMLAKIPGMAYGFFLGPVLEMDPIMVTSCGVGAMALLWIGGKWMASHVIPGDALVCALGVCAIAVIFVLTHTNAPGRLFYAAIPFVLVGSKLKEGAMPDVRAVRL